MREIQSKAGKTIHLATRQEIEAFPGYRAQAGGRKGRSCCPIHNGDNPTALSIDWDTGWASCWSCGDAFAIRVDDGRSGACQNRESAGHASQNVRNATSRPQTPKHDPEPVNTPVRDVTAKMAIAIAEALDRLPGSPGEHYLASRGIPLEVAQTLQLGWTDKGDLAGRVIFPLRDPLGQPTSATGRSVNDRTMPKYRTLPVAKGYMKTLFNGGAISVVRESGHPLVIVEGPIDAAACAAAGIPCVVAINGADYGHPEHFAGVRSAILAFDADEAGQKARRSVGLALISQGVDYVSLPAAAFEGSKDLGEFWQQHGTLPEQLVARVMGPHSLTRITPIVSSPQ
jgi:DNA primase